MYLSGIDENPELDLQELMDRIFDNYPHEFRQFWGLDAEHPPDDLDPDKWERYRDLDSLARRVTALAAVMVRPAKLPDAKLHAPRVMRQEAHEARRSLREFIQRVQAEHPDDRDLLRAVLDIRILEDVEYRFFTACLQLGAALSRTSVTSCNIIT